MNFRHVSKFGNHSFWGWVLGAEIIVGGTVGGVVGSPGGPIGVVGGAVMTAAALIGVSSGVKDLLQSDEPGPPPTAPVRPAPPAEGERLFPSAGKIYTAVSRSESGGKVAGSSVDGAYVLVGEFDHKEGRAMGSVGSAAPR